MLIRSRKAAGSDCAHLYHDSLLIPLHGNTANHGLLFCSMLDPWLLGRRRVAHDSGSSTPAHIVTVISPKGQRNPALS